MKNKVFQTVMIATALTITFAACKKDNAPTPDEQELITTVRLAVSNSSGFSKDFIYKVENGFNNSTPGLVEIDTIKLPHNQVFNAEVEMYNEKTTPSENITLEILDKDYEHLFLYKSVPLTGYGAIITSNGNKDKNGNPFNQSFVLTTDSIGNGKLTINLMHKPTDKYQQTPDKTGGETDVQITYPVLIQ